VAVPRLVVVGRLNRNVDNLLTTGGRLLKSLFLSEISSPFRSSGQSGEASPFLKSLFPEIRLAALLERSLNTALGWGWDKIAGDIATATHGNAIVGYIVTGQIPANTANQIDAICMAYTSGVGHRTPDTNAELAAIIPGVGGPGARDDIREKDDIFYVATDGTENHLEIKTPKPNYDQMRAAKRRILRILAARSAVPKVKAFVGMPYNPNGFFGEYGWPTTKYFADFTTDILVGREFWNYVGNRPDTYDELLDCFLEVAKTRKKELTELLGASS
jgi:hypothetical protein